MLQLLAWVDARPRTYGETMEAWRTSCPRMPIWEDATDGGLVEVDEAEVRLTAKGRAALTASAKADRRA